MDTDRVSPSRSFPRIVRRKINRPPDQSVVKLIATLGWISRIPSRSVRAIHDTLRAEEESLKPLRPQRVFPAARVVRETKRRK